MRLRVIIDHGSCIQSTNCVSIAPEHLARNAAEWPVVLRGKQAPAAEAVLEGLSEAQIDALREAASCCPAQAICLRDADTDEQLAP